MSTLYIKEFAYVWPFNNLISTLILVANLKNLNKFLKDTSLIKDRNLAYEVYMCVLYDDQYGPIANAVSEWVLQLLIQKKMLNQ